MDRMRRRQLNQRRAFTLIELIVSMTVSVIICGLAGTLVWNASAQQADIAARSGLVDIGSTAMEVMVRYLREIPQNECVGNPSPCLYGNAQVATATSTTIRWGNNGFRMSGGNLEMTTDNAVNWRTLATDVTAFSMTYYNRLGQDLATQAPPLDGPQYMRRIVITLTLARSNQTVTLRTGLFLRNFMNEVTTVPS